MASDINHALSVVVSRILVPKDDLLLLAQEEEEDARLIAIVEEYEVNGRSYINNDEMTL
jgi:hypothetical protein